MFFDSEVEIYYDLLKNDQILSQFRGLALEAFLYQAALYFELCLFFVCFSFRSVSPLCLLFPVLFLLSNNP
jgi:hypothetical protein